VYIASNRLVAVLLSKADSSVSIEMRSMMAKIGVMMSADRADEEMSAHFGKAEWIMVTDTESGICEFVKNQALNGKGAVEIVIRLGCTDVILADIGDGALRHLQAAHIRAWAVPAPVAGNEALRIFGEGQLSPVPPAFAAARQGGHHGRCCSSPAGTEAAICCQG
jgi:predicted Fe-Mo cluster-binding NifX family protein